MVIWSKDLFVGCFSAPHTHLKNLFFYALISMVIALPASASLPDGVSVSIALEQAVVTADDRIWANVTYSNFSDSEVSLLKYETVLVGGIAENLFLIERDGSEVAYSGIHAKRLAPIDSDYVSLKPNESVSGRVDLLSSYRIDYKGSYSVQMREPGDDASPSLSAKASAIVELSLTEDRAIRVLKQTPRFANCSAAQQSTIDAALTSAEFIANRAFDALRDAPESLRPGARRYLEWFGAHQSGRYSQVLLGMSRIASATSNQTIGFDCDCTNQPGVDPSRTFAFVFPSNAFNMTLCDVFFRVPRTGTDSQSGTIVHEISHFNVVASTDDFSSALNQSGSRNLANSSPASAIRNANAFEYFAENTPFLSMPTVADLPPPSTSDITLTSLSITPQPLEESGFGLLNGIVDNDGEAASAASRVNLSILIGGVPNFLGRATIASINGNGQARFEIGFNLPEIDGVFSFQVCLDETDDDTSNNCTTLSGIEIEKGGFGFIPAVLRLLLDD